MELSKHRKIFYGVNTSFRTLDPPRHWHDFGRVSLLPLPETAVMADVKPAYTFVRDYYTGEDEPVANNETTDLDRAAYQQWCLDRIDNPHLIENDDWEPSDPGFEDDDIRF